ncbi:MAG: hypothetical protein LUC27_05190 [Lachnospiraceae bacterium]|nr:hypothetical protein [Lachnospiraceae bacterium]
MAPKNSKRPSLSGLCRFRSGGVLLYVLFVPLLALLLTILTAQPQILQAETTAADLADGTYSVEVSMEGGSGRASITSPAVLTVEDGTAMVQIEWSSSHYDYMIVDEEKYLPVNEDGNSVFEIPVTVFDTEITVIADTTAMSTPHEIEYTLVFDSASISSGNTSPSPGAIIGAVLVLLLLCAAVVMTFRRRRKEARR